MKPKHFYPTILLLLLPVITGALLWPVSVSRAQGSEVFPEWRVYMKVAPCAGTLRDWMTVTDKQPVAGSNWYTPARDPVTGLTPPLYIGSRRPLRALRPLKCGQICSGSSASRPQQQRLANSPIMIIIAVGTIQSWKKENRMAQLAFP